MGGVTPEYRHSCWFALQQSDYLFPWAPIVNPGVLRLVRHARLDVAAVAGLGMAQKGAMEEEICVDQRGMAPTCLVL